MSESATRRFLVSSNYDGGATMVTIVEATEVRMDAQGYLMAFRGRGMCAAFTPGSWLSCVEIDAALT